MTNSIRIAKLINIILRDGKFHHGGYDFPEKRKELLADLQEFCPAQSESTPATLSFTKWLYDHPYLRQWVVQGAFLKSSLKTQPGHLSVPRLDLGYIRNPKAASTALCYAMLKAKYPELKNAAVSPEKINSLTDVNLSQRLTKADKQLLFFTVVRNPFARLVSVYREFFENASRDFLYEDYLFGVFRRDLIFKEFVGLLELIPEMLRDQHVRSQSAFLAFYHRKNIQVKILKLEEAGKIHDFLSGYGLHWTLFTEVNRIMITAGIMIRTLQRPCTGCIRVIFPFLDTRKNSAV